MRVNLLVLAAATGISIPASAQAQTGFASVDSASAARSAWRSAVTAVRRDDIRAAQRELVRASSAWPTQPSYTWYRAIFSARLGDTAAVYAALSDYAKLGLGRDLRDTTFDAYRKLPWFDTVAARHDANLAAVVRSRVRLTLDDSTLWPEGLDYDARHGKFFVTSVGHRTIVEVGAEGRERELWPRDQPGMGSVLAVRVDPSGAVVWATSAGVRQAPGFEARDSTIAALLQVRVKDGAILRRWDLTAESRHTLGDLAIGPRGDVLVTDSESPVLYRLAPGSDTLEAIRSPLFRSLQGIAPTPDWRVIYVADYSHGLLRVDLVTRNVTRVSDAENSTSLGCDGLAWYDNAIIAIQNGVTPARVMRFRLDASGERIVSAEVLDQNWPIADEPTLGTIVGDEFVYVANSQWEKYANDGRRNPALPLTRPVLLSVPLDRR